MKLYDIKITWKQEVDAELICYSNHKIIHPWFNYFVAEIQRIHRKIDLYKIVLSAGSAN